MIEEGKTIAIQLADNWPDDLAKEISLLGIAYAQLTREVYLAARRKRRISLAVWESSGHRDNVSKWIKELKADYHDNSTVLALACRATKAKAARDDVFHASWGSRSNGELNRWRRGVALGIDPEPIRELLEEIRAIRGELNRETRVNDKYSLKQSIAEA
jgi:hypothetical protein